MLGTLAEAPVVDHVEKMKGENHRNQNSQKQYRTSVGHTWKADAKGFCNRDNPELKGDAEQPAGPVGEEKPTKVNGYPTRNKTE